MLGDINTITLSGHLVADPVERKSKDGTKVFCSLKIRSKNRYNLKMPEFENILPVYVCDEEKAKLLLINTKEGDPVFLTGSLSYQKHPKKNDMILSIIHTSAHFLKPLSDYSADLSKRPSIQDDDLDFF